MAAVLASRAHRRLHHSLHSLASSTSKAYTKMFRTFLSFCVFVSINIFSISGAGFTKPPLERTSFSKGRWVFSLWEGHLKIQFHKASFNSPYQRSSLNLKEGANVLS